MKSLPGFVKDKQRLLYRPFWVQCDFHSRAVLELCKKFSCVGRSNAYHGVADYWLSSRRRTPEPPVDDSSGCSASKYTPASCSSSNILLTYLPYFPTQKFVVAIGIQVKMCYLTLWEYVSLHCEHSSKLFFSFFHLPDLRKTNKNKQSCPASIATSSTPRSASSLAATSATTMSMESAACVERPKSTISPSHSPNTKPYGRNINSPD